MVRGKNRLGRISIAGMSLGFENTTGTDRSLQVVTATTLWSEMLDSKIQLSDSSWRGSWPRSAPYGALISQKSSQYILMDPGDDTEQASELKNE